MARNSNRSFSPGSTSSDLHSAQYLAAMSLAAPHASHSLLVHRYPQRSTLPPGTCATVVTNDGTVEDGVAGLLAFVIGIALYVWMSLALSAMFRKMGEESWKGWVPFLNVATVLRWGGFSPWLVLLALIPPLSIVVFVLVVAFSRVGETRMGPDHSRPRFNMFTWAAMLFAAGIGVDLMFFGISGPATNVLTLQLLTSQNPSTIAANIALTFPEAYALNINVLIATGLILFIVIFAVNAVARWIVSRRKEFSGAN